MYGALQRVVLENIKKERYDVEGELVVIRTEEWGGGVYSLTPEDIGEIEVEYNSFGHRAIYGFTANGDVSIYMD